MAKKNTVAVKFTGDVRDLRKATGDAGGVLSGFGKKAAGVLKAGMAAAGAAGAAALVAGFNEFIANEKALDKTAAAFGLDPKTAEKLGKIAGDLYAEAYGESLGQVSDAVANVQRNLGELDDSQVKDLTANALDFAAAFDVEVNEAINAAGFLLKNNLVDDGEEAFDILTTAMQRMPPMVRDELLEATQEYSTFFEDLGLTGSEAFALIARAAQKGGKFGVDKVGDALKELTIRATDGSKASAEAYAMMGLSADEMARRFVAGGDSARGALDDLVDGLLGMENPVDRANAAIALFGTPIEDLSVTEIPQFLAQLDNMGAGLGDVAGAADEMGDTLNDNLSTKIEAFKRQGLQALAEFVEDKVIPAFERLHAFWVENIAPVIDTLTTKFKDDIWPAIQNVATVLNDEMTPAFEEVWRTIEEELVPAIGDLFQTIKDELGPEITELATVTIPVLIGAIKLFMHHIASQIWALSMLVRAFGGVIRIIASVKRAWDQLVAFLADKAVRIVETLQNIDWGALWRGAWSAIQTVLRYLGWLPSLMSFALIGIGSTLFSKGWDAIQGFINGMIAKAKDIGGVVKRNVVDPVVDAIKRGLSIFSPSLVTMGLGEHVGEGFALGIASKTGRVASMTKGLANAAMPSLSTLSVPGAGRVPAMAGAVAGTHQTIQVVLDGRVVAEAVNRHNADRARRNGGGRG